jgi:hypothetical protein
MISSDLHGDEEPHQMVAGMAETGQRCDEPLHEKKEGRST